ncbi:heavy metal transporter, partial [Streptomyces sp. SID625]|nr:heavy metal transporter [Streptomyces sp. SID625]
RGWQLAHWAVANASALHIERVAYAGREWTAGVTEGEWRAVDGKNGARPEGSAGSAATVRITTGR